MVVCSDYSSLYEHYVEMRDIQIKGSPEYKAYDFLVSRLWVGRGASLSFQRNVVDALLHEVEANRNIVGLWVQVVRSLKMFLSRTGGTDGRANNKGNPTGRTKPPIESTIGSV